MHKVGSPGWNDEMFQKHPTPYYGLAGFIERKRIRSIIKAIQKYYGPSPETIVELGCEAGNLLAALNQHFPSAQLYGLDISKEALQKAQEKLAENVILQFCDITEPIPPIPNPTIIICSETLEHIPACDTVLKNIAQLADQHTILIFTVPLEQLKNRLKSILNQIGLFQLLFKGIETEKSEWHVQDFSKTDFINLVEKHFTVLNYRQIWGLHQEIIAKHKECR